MKKVLLVLVSLAALAAIAGVLTGIFFPESLSTSNRRIKGSGTIVTRTIPAPDFEKISASRAVKVIITDEIEDRIRIEADDNLMDHIVAEASGDELRISIDPKINSVSDIHVTVTVPDNGRIRALEASSASEITCATALGAADISLEASSAANINAAVKAGVCSLEATSAAKIKAAVEAGECRINASSAAKIKLSGRADTARAELSSASKLAAAELVVKQWKIDTSSAASARIHCTEQLDAEASSGSSIHYEGDCSTDITKSSGGSVSR